MKEYGLHPSLWRNLRSVNGGFVDIPVHHRKGVFLGSCQINRYGNTIYLDNHINFHSIDFKRLIESAKNTRSSKMLEPTKINVTEKTFG